MVQKITTVVIGSASGIGAAVRARLEKSGHGVIGIDIKGAEIITDLSAREGRQAAVAEVRRRCGDVIQHGLTIWEVTSQPTKRASPILVSAA